MHMLHTQCIPQTCPLKVSHNFPRISLTGADLKADGKGNNGKNWLLSPGTSSQSEGYMQGTRS